MSPSFHINRKVVLTVLLSVWFALWAAAALQEVGLILIESTTEVWDRRIWLLDVNFEASLYTWFSTLLLALSGLIALVLATFQGGPGKKFKTQWQMVGGLLLFLSMDEMLSFHERLNGLVDKVVSTSGIFAFSWVIPAIVLVGGVAVLFIPFLRSLPFVIARGIFLAGAVFVMGAVGMEMMGAGIVSTVAGEGSQHNYDLPVYRFVALLEEGLEVLGVLILIRTLLLQAALYVPDLFDAPVTAGPGFDPQPQLAARAGGTL